MPPAGSGRRLRLIHMTTSKSRPTTTTTVKMLPPSASAPPPKKNSGNPPPPPPPTPPPPTSAPPPNPCPPPARARIETTAVKPLSATIVLPLAELPGSACGGRVGRGRHRRPAVGAELDPRRQFGAAVRAMGRAGGDDRQ